METVKDGIVGIGVVVIGVIGVIILCIVVGALANAILVLAGGGAAA